MFQECSIFEGSRKGSRDDRCFNADTVSFVGSVIDDALVYK